MVEAAAEVSVLVVEAAAEVSVLVVEATAEVSVPVVEAAAEVSVLIVEAVAELSVFGVVAVAELSVLEAVVAAELSVLVAVELSVLVSPSSYLKSFNSLLPPELSDVELDPEEFVPLAPGNNNSGKSTPIMINFFVASSYVAPVISPTGLT